MWEGEEGSVGGGGDEKKVKRKGGYLLFGMEKYFH